MLRFFLTAFLIGVSVVWAQEGDESLIPEDPCDTGNLILSLESENVPEVCGALFVNASVQKEPRYLSYQQAKEGKKYALVMVDPDIPQPPDKWYLHWLLDDIQGKTLEIVGDSSEEDNREYREVRTYKPPNPPAGSGPHRYQLFVFVYHSDLVDIPRETRIFDLDNFVTANNLQSPVAAFEYTVEGDL